MKDIGIYGFIYITTNTVNGKKYIGQKVFIKGWKTYLGSGTNLLKAIKKYGRENFIREIIAVACSSEELNLREIETIKNHNAVNDSNYYNISFGGDAFMAGRKLSDDAKRKIGAKSKGRSLSAEARLLISVANKGRTKSKELRKKFSLLFSGSNNPNFGKHLSAESKARIGNANRCKSPSRETREKMRSAQTGRKLSEESKRKVSMSKIKFNQDQVIEIRRKYAFRKYTQPQLAKEYSCSRGTISAIINLKGMYKTCV